MKLLTLIIIHIFSVLLNAQKSSIIGYVVEEKSHQPIFNANVYIANSTIGTTSDQNGFFRIENIDPGNYKVIASHVSYKFIYIHVTIKPDQLRQLNFGMDKKLFEISEVVVEDGFDDEWLDNYEIFEEEILGQTENADYTKIINPEIINFYMKDDTLIAECNEKLKIINYALGYELMYFLDRFEHFERTTLYNGIPFFTELKPEKEDQKKEWEYNRLKTYNGSLRHFLRTISTQSEYYSGIDTINIIISDSSLGGYAFEYDSDTYLANQGYEFYHIDKGPWEKSIIKTFARPIHSDSILTQANSQNEFLLNFDDYLQIVQLKEDDKITRTGKRYDPKHEDSFRPLKSQTSWITIHADSVIIDKKGRYYDKFKIQTFGYFSYQRLADMLPLDFIPADSTLANIKSFD